MALRFFCAADVLILTTNAAGGGNVYSLYLGPSGASNPNTVQLVSGFNAGVPVTSVSIGVSQSPWISGIALAGDSQGGVWQFLLPRSVFLCFCVLCVDLFW